MKRGLDIFCSLLSLLLLLPLLLPLALVLKCTGEGYVFYKQERVGLGQKRFFILKFATMLKDSPNLGTGDITLREDPRVLPLGRLLRKSKINELPQIWNVLAGNMSLVGPRPLTPGQFEQYPEKIRSVIASVTPGITGVSAIVFRDEESLLSGKEDPQSHYSSVLLPLKAQLECWYASNRTIFIDILLIFLTFIIVVRPKSRLPLEVLSSKTGLDF